MPQELRRILLGLAGGPFDDQICSFVFGMAATSKATVACQLIRPMEDDPGVLLACGFSGDAFRHFIESAEKSLLELDAVARQALEKAHQAFPVVEFEYQHSFRGDSYEFASQGWGADVVILAHPALMNAKYYLSVVVEAITYSGRPVLLLPSRLPEDLLASVAFIWRYDSHSSAAMAITLPVLKAARKLTILSLRDSDAYETPITVPLQYLKAHGIEAQHVMVDLIPHHADQAVDGCCAEIGASLLIGSGVMDSDLEDYFVTGVVRRAKGQPQRPLLIIG